MKTQRILIALTVINLGLLLFQLTGMRRVEAVTPTSSRQAAPRRCSGQLARDRR